MISLGLWVWEGRPQKQVPFSSQSIKGTYYQYNIMVNVSLEHSTEAASVRFLHSSFQNCALQKEVIIHGSYLGCGELCSTSLKVKYLHKLLGILLYGKDLSIFPHLLIHSFIDISIDSRIFVLWLVCNPMPHYLLCCSSCSSFGLGALSMSFCVPLTYAHHHV